MKKIFTLLTAVGLMSFAGHAQLTSGKVTGNVISSNKPVDAATINLLKATDSSIIKAAVSSSGKFSFENIPGGKYLIAITAVGFSKQYTPSFQLNEQNPTQQIAAIQLTAVQKALREVTVSAKRPFIEQRAGKTLINVEASPTNSGLNALEVLEKSPGVSVDKDGNISLRGKQGVMILVDGKPTYLSGADLAALLKNMQSNNLDQIEIMTNPPAKYDAAGNSGIINIKTKKNTVRGMNGSISNTYTQGLYGRTNNSFTLNYRNNKLNVFGGYGFNYYEGYNSLLIDRRFYDANKNIVGSADQASRPHFKGYNNNIKAGLDYNFSKKDVAGFVVNSNFNNGKEDPSGLSYIRNAAGEVLYSLRSSNDNSSTFSNISTNFNYKHTFDSTGKEISADADYVHYKKSSHTLMTTETFDGAGFKNSHDVKLRGEIPSDINIFSVKVDYVHPISKTLKVEAGAKSSYVNSDNMVAYTRDNGTGWKADDRSNHFKYQENINAGYVSVSKSWKKWNLDAGLRVENTNAKGKQFSNDSSFKRDYTNVFPNIGLSYEASRKHQFNFSYSRRIDRPDYDDLNPFVFFLDSLTYGKGNPYLQPQFTNKLEFSHTYGKFLTTSINYAQTDDVITQLLKQDTEKKITYQTRENVNKMRQVGMTVAFNAPITKWWNTNIYVNIFNNHYTGLYQSDPIDIQFTSFATNINNSFSFGKGWGAEVGGFYRSKGADGLLVANPMYLVNAGVSKQVLNKKGTIRLSVRDIFFTQRFSGYARYSDVDVNLSSTRDSRQVSASFVYRFGKTNIAPARRRTGGAGDEQNRIKGGGN
jgi:iron complex outermembrane receptor protein